MLFISHNNHRPPNFTDLHITSLTFLTELMKNKSFSNDISCLYLLFQGKPPGLLSNFEKSVLFALPKYADEIFKVIFNEGRVSYSEDIEKNKKEPYYYYKSDDQGWIMSTAEAIIEQLRDSETGKTWSISPTLTFSVELWISDDDKLKDDGHERKDDEKNWRLTNLHFLKESEKKAVFEDGFFQFKLCFDKTEHFKFLDFRSILLAIMLPLKVPSGVTFLEYICKKGADFFNLVYSYLSDILVLLGISFTPEQASQIAANMQRSQVKEDHKTIFESALEEWWNRKMEEKKTIEAQKKRRKEAKKSKNTK